MRAWNPLCSGEWGGGGRKEGRGEKRGEGEKGEEGGEEVKEILQGLPLTLVWNPLYRPDTKPRAIVRK